MSEKERLAFELGADQPLPSAFIQWKGTDVCMDFSCDCCEGFHIDAMFVYAVKCHACGTIWQMPSHVYPRRAPADYNGCIHITTPEDDDG